MELSNVGRLTIRSSRSGDSYEFQVGKAEMTLSPDFIGRGGFGLVYRCRRVQTKESLAVKLIDIGEVIKTGTSVMNEVNSEIKWQLLMTEKGYPFFLRLVDFHFGKRYIFIFTDLCKGDLSLIPTSTNNRRDHVIRLVFQAGIALSLFHAHGLIHRDIKIENILVKQQNQNFIAFIADFGLARAKDEAFVKGGTEGYMAPEVSQKFARKSGKIDVYALNAVFTYLMFSEFDSDGGYNLLSMKEINLILKESLSKGKLSQDIFDLIREGFQKDQDIRPTMLEYIEHRAFVPLHKEFKNELSLVYNLIDINKERSFVEDSKRFTATSKGPKLPVRIQDHLWRLLAYRNNLKKEYGELAQFTQENELNKIFSFWLVKRHIQRLSVLLIGFYDRKVPELVGYPRSDLQSDWLFLCDLSEFKKLIVLVQKDIQLLKISYQRLLDTLNKLKAYKRQPIPSLSIDTKISPEFILYLGYFKNILPRYLSDHQSLLKKRITNCNRIEMFENPNSISSIYEVQGLS